MDNDATKTAEAVDDQEWDHALGEFSEERGIKSEDDGKGDADAEAAKKAEDDAVAKKAEEDARANESPEDKAAREAKEAEEAAKADPEAAERARSIRDTRATQKEIVADETAMREDIRKELFSDVPDKLTDADGDPIETIEDVMKLVNPNTQKLFTEDEAGKYLLAASQHLAKRKEEVEKEVAKIADVNISIKDQVDVIREKYGDFLNKPENHALRDEILQDYFDTLVRDPDTDIITGAPVSMERFYDRALKDKVEAAAKANEPSEAEKKAQEEADRAKKLEEENRQLKTRSDREDIFSRGGNKDLLDDDDKEWADATKTFLATK